MNVICNIINFSPAAAQILNEADRLSTGTFKIENFKPEELSERTILNTPAIYLIDAAGAADVSNISALLSRPAFPLLVIDTAESAGQADLLPALRDAGAFDVVPSRPETLARALDRAAAFLEPVLLLDDTRAKYKQLKLSIDDSNKTMIDSRDFDMAVRLQQSLLPQPLKSQIWDTAYVYIPWAGLSGDFVDFYNFSDLVDLLDEQQTFENLGIVLLDAVGHGIASSLISIISRPVFFKAHRENKNHILARAVMDANIELVEQISQTHTYMTGISMRLKKDHISYVNAGHPSMLYYSKERNITYALPNDGGFLGSADYRTDLKSRRIDVSPGDVFLLYTDGFIETPDKDGNAFKLEKILPVLKNSSLTAVQMKDRILKILNDCGINEETVTDDLTFIVVKRT